MFKSRNAGSIKLLLMIFILLNVFAFWGCGGSLDTPTTPSSSDGSTPTPTTPAAYVDLLVSSPQTGSDGSSTVTVMAIVKSSGNNALKDKTVSFSSTYPSTLVVESGTTDKNGLATATLSAAGNKANRTISISAQADSIISTTTVDVIGTTISIDGASAMVSGASTIYTFSLKDSTGKGIDKQNITLTSSKGNIFSINPVKTDNNGQAEVTYTAAPNGGAEVITATALGTTKTQEVTISTTDFTFIAPAADKEINIGTLETVAVHYALGDVPQAGVTINFASTRGTITSSGVTDASGNTSATLSSTTAGPATIAATVADGGAIQTTVLFVAVTPSAVTLQASPAVIATNVAESATQQSTITAVVKDASGNRVKNVTVHFSLYDVTGGSLTLESSVTDSMGTASTVYISSSAPSTTNDVQITATVGTIIKAAYLTVSGKPYYVVFGTGNKMEDYGTTQYRLPYTALVTDLSGNPKAGVEVTATLTPVEYYKGFTFGCTSNTDVYWQTNYSAAASTSRLACSNEDNNPAIHTLYPQWRLNGDLDRDIIASVTEDINGDNEITPKNVATITNAENSTQARATTGADGFAQFYVIYAKQFARWVKVRIDGYILTYGTESVGSTQFELPATSADMLCTASVPGPISPWGRGVTPNNVCTNND
jgi:hypothetical protein